MLIYSHETLWQVHHIKQLLHMHGIDCHIRNDNLTSLAGEVPITDTWPELWLVDKEQAPQAEKIIKETLTNNSSALPAWKCEQCQEVNEGQFAICWQCGNMASKS
ncbi:putative signal transducing protein [Thalassotalea maritima]|uniref:putative signal transducing protein n=1 Tax=Thalassotalea maritima TaxID=3242416 RepID=UPI003528B50B